MIHVYQKFAEEWMSLPVVVGHKSPNERFAGAEDTLTIEALMQNRREFGNFLFDERCLEFRHHGRIPRRSPDVGTHKSRSRRCGRRLYAISIKKLP